MRAGLTFEVPVRTLGGDNSRRHRLAANDRTRREKQTVLNICASYQPAERCRLGDLLRAMAARGPLDVRVVRLYTGTRPADPQNLGSKLKAIIDGLALVFRIDDGDARIRYLPAQERARAAGVRVEVSARRARPELPEWTPEDWRRIALALTCQSDLIRRELQDTDGEWLRALARGCAGIAAALEGK